MTKLMATITQSQRLGKTAIERLEVAKCVIQDRHQDDPALHWLRPHYYNNEFGVEKGHGFYRLKKATAKF